jgi:hypothetical protein
MATQIINKQFIRLDAINLSLDTINNTLLNQSIQMYDQSTQLQKMIHQLRINNMYKSHENDFIIDDNIFENDEID